MYQFVPEPICGLTNSSLTQINELTTAKDEQQTEKGAWPWMVQFLTVSK